jgi:hypothetical protein
MFGSLSIGIGDLFVIWCLGFGKVGGSSAPRLGDTGTRRRGDDAGCAMCDVKCAMKND